MAKLLFVAFGLAVANVSAGSLIGMSFTGQAVAAVVNSIEVRGNQRIDDTTVASYLTIVPGQRFSNFDIDDSIKALYRTDLFSDVAIYQQGSVLVVEVDENAVINKVVFEGNKRLKDDALAAIVSLRNQGIYSDEQAAADVDRISDAYGRVGRRDAHISYEVLPLENNRVNVIYRVDEGGKTKISAINFIGNTTFSEQHLKDTISTKESTFLSFLQSNDVYDPNRLSADEEALRRFYLNRGFADFQVLSTTADLDEAANEYTITFTIEEGARYTFGSVEIDSTVDGVDNEALAKYFKSVPGEFYSANKVDDTVVALTQQIAELGVAFVEVAPRGNRNFDTNTIDVVYLVDEGARVFIEDIVILGNDRTRDYVIRREFDVSEGDAYNQVLVQKTKRRIQELNFFDSVEITTRPGSSADRVRLIVNVKEKSTGDISLSGGYSSSGGVSGEISVTERNFLGRGQFLKVAFASGENQDSYSLAFTEPFFLGNRMSAGFKVERIVSDAADSQTYNSKTLNGTFTFGVPITENLQSSVFYAFRNEDITAGTSVTDSAAPAPPVPSTSADDGRQGNRDSELSNALFDDIGSYTASGIGYSLTYSTLDDSRRPRDGARLFWTQTVYGAGGDARYLSSEANLVGYSLLSEENDLVLMGRVRAGHREQFGGDKSQSISDTMRTLDNFKASSGTIRGFDSLGYGPRDPLTNDALGGQTFWNATAEVQFPLPFLSRSLGLRGALFADAGQLFNPGDGAIAAITNAAGGALTAEQLAQADNDSIRASVGGSIIWDSPFGPLRVDYSVPISEETFDDVEEINFGISSAF